MKKFCLCRELNPSPSDSEIKLILCEGVTGYYRLVISNILVCSIYDLIYEFGSFPQCKYNFQSCKLDSSSSGLQEVSLITSSSQLSNLDFLNCLSQLSTLKTLLGTNRDAMTRGSAAICNPDVQSLIWRQRKNENAGITLRENLIFLCWAACNLWHVTQRLIQYSCSRVLNMKDAEELAAEEDIFLLEKMSMVGRISN
jgi:hypothetical protein